MARPKKQTVDYYPHQAKSGKTIFILESRWGNDGYAFFHKLLEALCSTESHVIDYGNHAEREFLLAKTRINEQTATEILNMLADLGKIDQELWSEGRIWYQNLVNNIKDAYKKRMHQFPQKPSFRNQKPNSTEFPTPETPLQRVSDTGSTESKVEKSKVKESKEEEEIRNVFFFFQNEIGIISNVVADKLADNVKEYSATWVIQAIRIAALRGKRSLGYAESILSSWKTNGYGCDQKPWEEEDRMKGAKSRGTDRRSGRTMAGTDKTSKVPSRSRKSSDEEE